MYKLAYIFSAVMLLAAMFSPISASAAQDEWQNPNVNEVNRAPMHSFYFAYPSYEEALGGDMTSSSNYLSLNGKWKFNIE